MKKLLLVFAVLLILCLPVMAQDATAEPPVMTIPVEQIPDETPAILSLTLGELLGILFGAGALMVGIGKILWDANQNPGGASIDTRVAERVESAHSDREWVEKLERAYELGQGQVKVLTDAFTKILVTVAPLTPLKVDDAALSLLQDIQQPGATTTTTTTTTGDYVQTSAGL